MHLQRFTERGIERFAQFLDSVPEYYDAAALEALMSSAELATDVAPAIEVDRREFASRYEAAAYFHTRLAGLPGVETDVGLWSWLAAFLFDQLCPADSKGRRRPGERARWIPDLDSHRKYYRHLLAGPYRFFKAHPDAPRRALALLCGALARPGELNEQLASRQEIVSNKAAMEVATRLYVDPDTARPKPRAAGKARGSVRRLATILKQYDLTWDLNALSADELLQLLPR